jgi:hypothetical protein
MRAGNEWGTDRLQDAGTALMKMGMQASAEACRLVIESVYFSQRRWHSSIAKNRRESADDAYLMSLPNR